MQKIIKGELNMKAGFIPSLETPLDSNGNLCVESYKKQIEDQIKEGAIGLFFMGSMGQQPYIRQDVCPQVAAAVEAAAGRVPGLKAISPDSVER